MNDAVKLFFETEEVYTGLDPSIDSLNENKNYSFQKTMVPMRKKNSYVPKLVGKADFKLNNYGHRSSNFNKLDSTKINILFAGCSETFGEGLPEKHSWPHYVINEIKKEIHNLGPDQILSFPGGSLSKIVRNIFKYVEMFGAPNFIIVYLPDIFRADKYDELKKIWSTETVYDFEKGKIKERFKDINMNELLKSYMDIYNLLRIFCKANNITLMSSSWNNGVNIAMSRIYPETFREFSFDSVLDYFKSKEFDNQYFSSLDPDFAHFAADSMHSGTISNMYTGKIFIDWIKEYA